MFGGCVGAVHLGLHVVYLKSEDRQAVQSPSRTLGIDCRIGRRHYAGVLCAEIGIKFFNHIGTLLVGAVYTALERQSGHRVDFGVAYYILQMPLHGVYAVFGIEYTLYALGSVGLTGRSVDIVVEMIIGY